MGIITTIQPDKNLVHHRISGVLTMAEILPAISNLFSHPDFDPAMNILAEVEPGSTSGLSVEEIHNIVTIFRNQKNRQGSGMSVVVAPDNADYGIMHALEFLLKNDQRDFKVVKTTAEAEAWLSQKG